MGFVTVAFINNNGSLFSWIILFIVGVAISSLSIAVNKFKNP
jgi:hypothetical protein